jgi:hypothetical protein
MAVRIPDMPGDEPQSIEIMGFIPPELNDIGEDRSMGNRVISMIEHIFHFQHPHCGIFLLTEA